MNTLFGNELIIHSFTMAIKKENITGALRHNCCSVFAMINAARER